MTDDRLPRAELLAKAEDSDFLRSVAEAVLQMLMEADVEGLIGAGRHERTGERLNYRNGFRDWTLDTRLGSLQLRIPKLRQGSYFPPFLEPRKTSEKALVAVIQEAWIGGVSTRRVDDLVQAMGLSSISKSTVSELCKDIDERIGAFLDRPLSGEWPYLWLDATYLRQREGGRIVSVAAIIAVACDAEGRREIVGLHIGPSEAETFWAAFLKTLVKRGLKGVKLVVSDAHEGLKAAIARGRLKPTNIFHHVDGRYPRPPARFSRHHEFSGTARTCAGFPCSQVVQPSCRLLTAWLRAIHAARPGSLAGLVRRRLPALPSWHVIRHRSTCANRPTNTGNRWVPCPISIFWRNSMYLATLIGQFRSEFHAAPPQARSARLRELLSSEFDAPTRFQVSDAAYSIDPVVTVEVLSEVAGQRADREDLRRFLVWHLIRQGDFVNAKQRSRHFAIVSETPAFWHELVVRASLLMTPAETQNGFEVSGSRLAPELRRSTYGVAAALAGDNPLLGALAERWRQDVEAGKSAALAAAGACATALDGLLSGFAKARSIALVGNGPSLVGSGKGAIIDGFDAVVRVNFPPIAGRERDVGWRTDAVFFTETLFMGPFIEPLLDRDRVYRDALIASFEGSTGGAKIVEPERRMTVAGARRYYRLPPELRAMLVAMTYDGHTTGLVTLVFLAALLGKRVRLFGFDFYAAGSHNYWTEDAPAPPLHHELQFEQFYVERFLARLFDVTHEPG